MRISVPCPGWLSTVMRPPSPSTTFFAMARPSPDPVRLVVKYGSNTLGRSSGEMPGPVSRTTIVTPSSPRLSV